MRDESVKFRPEVSKELKKQMDSVLEVYQANQRGAFYRVTALFFEEKGKKEEADILNSASMFLLNWENISTRNLEEYWEWQHKDKVSGIKVEGIRDLGAITEVEAFKFLIGTYENTLKEAKESIDVSDFTSEEQFMLGRFFSVLENPLRNKKLEDASYSDLQFKKDMEDMVEFAKTDLGHYLSMWGDKEEENVSVGHMEEEPER